VKRWNTALSVLVIGGALFGCQNQLDTSSTEAAVSCPVGGNYPNAKLPQVETWTKTLDGQPGETYVSFEDPNNKGYYLVFLANPTSGTIRWAARFKAADRQQVRGGAGNYNWLDVGRIPPVPVPPGPGPGPVGDDLMAKIVLEAAHDVVDLPQRAVDEALTQ
jgi:hypothetical protein